MEKNVYHDKLMDRMIEIKDKYPNIVNLWEKVIRKKEEDLKKTYEDCNKMLDNIDSLENDLPMNTILTLYLLKIYST